MYEILQKEFKKRKVRRGWEVGRGGPRRELVGELPVVTSCSRIGRINGLHLRRRSRGHLPREELQPSRTAAGLCFQCTPPMTFCPCFSQRADKAESQRNLSQ